MNTSDLSLVVDVVFLVYAAFVVNSIRRLNLVGIGIMLLHHDTYLSAVIFQFIITLEQVYPPFVRSENQRIIIVIVTGALTMMQVLGLYHHWYAYIFGFTDNPKFLLEQCKNLSNPCMAFIYPGCRAMCHESVSELLLKAGVWP